MRSIVQQGVEYHPFAGESTLVRADAAVISLLSRRREWTPCIRISYRRHRVRRRLGKPNATLTLVSRCTCCVIFGARRHFGPTCSRRRTRTNCLQGAPYFLKVYGL